MKKYFLKNKYIKYNNGQALITSLVFFTALSTSLVVGLVSPTISEYKLANTNTQAKKSFYLSESGIEDAYYRIKEGKTIGLTESITIDGNIATTTIIDVGSQKTISAEGDVSNRDRVNEVVLQAGTGVAFNYGVQVGQGGVVLSGSGTVNGNLYANGPISGDSSAIITGTAISGNSPASNTDQENGSGTPAYDVIFANNNSTQDIAQSFQVSTSSPLNKVQFYIKKVSTPSDTTVSIVNDSSGLPGTTVYATGTLSASTVSTSYGWIDVAFTSNPLLSVGTTYWIVVDASTNSSKYYTIGANSAGYVNGIGKIGRYGNSWSNTTPSGLDYFFKIYLGGVNGYIYGTSGSQWNQLHVGTVSGTAQANTVNYTNATGNIYCQSGTGNNKSCTYQADPTYIAFPVSDANIESWKDEAEAGGVYNGNYSVGWAGATLGPLKINGNLTVSNGGALTVAGTLWVTGTITLNGGGLIQLSPSYGANDGVVLSDGNIAISGGGHATGSGTPGSYIMILTTSNTTNAMSVSGGAGAVIAYAPNGTMSISGGASLKEAVAYKMIVSGGSSITYESGLANSNFSSGPSGGWEVQSWKETE